MVFAATLLKTMCVCVSEREREGAREVGGRSQEGFKSSGSSNWGNGVGID